MALKVDLYFCLGVAAVLVLAACGSSEDAGTPSEPLADSQRQRRSGPENPPYEVVELSSVGTVRGTVRLTGEAPVLSPISISKDQEVCGLEMADISLQLGPGATVEGAVVSLLGVSRGKALPPPSRRAELELIKCNGVPRVQIVPLGTTLELYNSDPLLHDVYAYLDPSEELFHIALPLQNYRARVELDRSGLIQVRCGAGHPWMRAYIFVHEHPYTALTSSRGTYVLSDIPAGTYDLQIWHELLGQKESTLTVEAGATVTLDFELEYTSSAGEK